MEVEKDNMKNIAKILCFVLALAAVFTIIGVTAFAEEGTSVAKIGETEYATLQAAIDAVQEGETITLIDDVEVTEAAYGQNALNHARAVSFTLDLNTFTLEADTGNSVFRFNIAGSGATSDITVTVKNGKVVSGSNTWCALMSSGISADVRAVLNLENLVVENSKAYDFAIKAWGNGVVNAKNVTVNATNQAGGFYAVGGEVVLDDCTVNQSGLYSAPYTSMAFAVSGNGKLTINSGSYTATPTSAEEGNGQGSTHGSWCGGVMNSGGTLIINGGTFSNGNFGDDSLATAARGLIVVDAGANLEINGGTFNALDGVIDYCNNLGDASKNPVAVVYGGSYNSDSVIKYVETGYVITLNGNDVFVLEDDTTAVPVVTVDGKGYTDLASALKAVKADSVVDILDDITIIEYWDCRYTGAKISVPVTINGNGHTIKFTNTVYDAGNQMAAFRFEAEATVKDLTMDLSEALSGWGTRLRAISTKANLTVDGCTFIGNGASNNTRAIIFGEGSGAAVGNLVVSITNSTFEGWKRGVSDNENAQDVKSVEISGCEFTNAGVSISAAESIIFTGNTVSGAPVAITSYSATNALEVVATGNTLDAKQSNWISASDVTIDETFGAVAKIGDNYYSSLQAAVNAAGVGEIVVLLDNITLTKTVRISAGYVVTIDLNGYTVDYDPEVWVYGGDNSGTALITVDFGGDLTIMDSSDAKTGTLDASYSEEDWDNYKYDVYSAIMMTGKGDNADNGTAKLTVNSGTLKGFFAAIAGNRNRDNTEITINGGYVTAGVSQKYSTAAIEHPMNGKLTINGGTLEGMDGISFRSGTLVINGGTIIGTAPESAFEDDGYWDNNFGACTGHALQIVNRVNSEATQETPSVTINGGTFISKNAKAIGSYAGYKGETPDTAVTGFVAGGVFNTEVAEELLADGFKPVKNVHDGNYYVLSAAPSVREDTVNGVKTGYWFIGDINTGVIAVPNVTVNEDGNWVINGIVATDENGDPIRAEAVDGFNPVVTFVEDDGVKYWAIDLDGEGGEAPVNTGVKAQAFDGVGIEKIEYVSTAGNIDTYAIVYTDGFTTYFTVTHGLDGAQGPVGPQGEQGPKGEDGLKGDDGKDGNDGSEVVKTAVIVSVVCAVLTLGVLGYRIFRRKSF